MLDAAEAAGVELETRVENAEVIDSGNARIGTISMNANSIVRSLYGHFSEFQNSRTPRSDGPSSQEEHSEVQS